MNLDAIFRAANENTDPDPSERDFEELMANALRVCLDDLLANRGPLTDEQKRAMFARLRGGRGATRSWDAPTGDRFGSEIYAKKPWWKSAKDWGGKEAEEYASKGFMGKATDFMDELASIGMMGTAMGGTGRFTADTLRSAKSQAGILARTKAAWNAWKARQAAAAAAKAAQAHYQKTYGIQPADTAIIKRITGDIQTQARLRDLWWDKKDLFRDPNTAKVDYNAAMKYLRQVAGKSSAGE